MMNWEVSTSWNTFLSTRLCTVLSQTVTRTPQAKYGLVQTTLPQNRIVLRETFCLSIKTKWYKWFCLKMSCRNLHYFPDADGHKWHTHMSCWSKYSPWFYYIQVLGPPLPWSMVSLSPNPRVLWVGVGRGCISSVLMVSPFPPGVWVGVGVGWSIK